jgi:hypothetical protein
MTSIALAPMIGIALIASIADGLFAYERRRYERHRS